MKLMIALIVLSATVSINASIERKICVKREEGRCVKWIIRG